jgi:hypothetical protein
MDHLLPVGLAPAVPRPGSGVCRICRGPTTPGFPRCFCCARLGRLLGNLVPVVPATLCVVPGPWHTVLRGYKDDPSPARRGRYAAWVGRVLRQFVVARAGELSALAGGPPDGALCVPPTRARAGGEALAAVARTAGFGVDPELPPLWSGLVAWAPAAPALPGARCRRRSAVVARRPPLAGRRVLLLDDTLTTGSSVQCTAAALVDAGARAVVAVVLGRTVRPTVSAAHAVYWQGARPGRWTPGDAQRAAGAPGAPGAPGGSAATGWSNG